MFFAGKGIEFPPELERRLTQALWNEEPSASQLSARAASLNKLWEKLAKRRGMVAGGETHYSFLRQEAEAYASYYLPANALKTALVLEEAFLLGLDLLSGKAEWLDFGTGPGTAYWGLSWWAEKREKAFQFTGIDQSPVFAEIASRLAGGASSRPVFRAESRIAPAQMVRKAAPTHVSFVNSLAEIFPDTVRREEECRQILAALADHSKKDGRSRYLLLVEPGSRESSRELAALKDVLQETAACQVTSPCLDNRKCGALLNPKDWCHEEVACRFPSCLNELGAEAGLRKESMLFSYALIRAGAASDTKGGWRVVSQRLERKGQVECWLCTPEGKRMVRAQRSKAGPESKSVLEACRGDIWNSAELGAKGDLLAADPRVAGDASVFQELS